MSNNYYENDKLSLTAFVGGESGNCVQMTFKERPVDYIQLTEEEALEIAINLLLRVNFSVSATGDEEGIYKLKN